MEFRGRHLVWLSSVVLIILFTFYYTFALSNAQSPSSYSSKPSDKFKAPKHNVWAELSESEAESVNTFVLEKFDHLNLTAQPKSSRDNFIFLVETLKPNKTDAASYLYDDAGLPERWAKASIAQNFDDGPYMVFYRVGPLPLSDQSTILPLDYVFNSGCNSVRNPVVDFWALAEFGRVLAANASDVTQELLGATISLEHPDDPRGLEIFPRGSIEHGRLVLWFQMFRPGLGSNARTLLPQGIYVKVDAGSPNPQEWTVGQWYYNGVLYNSLKQFRAALADPAFVSTPPNLDGPWTETEDFDSEPAGRELPPPLSIQPYGPRYKLDRKENFVSWFGFEFYFTTAQATGMSLFDIRFKGERVMYELGLQEALAHYAGEDPMAGGQEFLDTFFGMGNNAFELVPGYDCPAYADYIDAQWHRSSKTYTSPNSICVFEYTADYLLSRHTAQYSVTASRNTFLTVRSVSTVGNYDYTIDYILYLDGTLEVKVRASGFIFGAFYTANTTKNEDQYGYRLHDALVSSAHDHVINFRADMDVAGPTNNLVRLAIEPLTKKYSWEEHPRNTMHIVEYPVTEEAGIDWPKNSGEYYIVYSDKKNAWGERKGYRVTSGTGMGSTPHLTILNSTALGDSARWAEHDLWVLRRKDTEPRSADPLNYFTPHDPLIDFTKMANHESLHHGATENAYDGDLVIYFNLGAHHVPTSSDIPNTLMHTSASAVMFIPHNFHDHDASRENVQGVRLQLSGQKGSGGFAGQELESVNGDLRSRTMQRRAEKETKKTKARYFGKTYEKGLEVPIEQLEPDMGQYVSAGHDITDLTYNGSAAGVWQRE